MSVRNPSETRPNLRAAHHRFLTIGEVSGARIDGVYLRRTLRSLTYELALLRAAKQGPTFVVGIGSTGKRGYFFKWDEIVRHFGGLDSLFHRDDEPELFEQHVRPSLAFRRGRTASP